MPRPRSSSITSATSAGRSAPTWAWRPSRPADEVDPIGAGEILAGAFLALRARGLAEDRALRYAVAVATRSVTEFGVTGPAVTRELSRVRAELAASLRS